MERRFKRVSIGTDMLVSVLSNRVRLVLPEGTEIHAIQQANEFYPPSFYLIVFNPTFDVVPANTEIPLDYNLMLELVESVQGAAA